MSRIHCDRGVCDRRLAAICDYCGDSVCKECVKNNYGKFIKKYPTKLGTKLPQAYTSIQYCASCNAFICNMFNCDANHKLHCKTSLYWSFGTIDDNSYSDDDNN